MIAFAPQELHFQSVSSGLGYTIDAFYSAHESGCALGGDWYDIFLLPDGKLVMTIGDVVGSNREAERIMKSLRQVMHTIGLAYPQPNTMLMAADNALRKEYPEAYATALAGIFDPDLRTFTFASAGHPNPLLLHSDGSFTEASTTGLPLGLRTSDEPGASEISLAAGTTMMLYTDGLIESTRSLNEGKRRLKEALKNPVIRSHRRFAHQVFQHVLFDGVFDDVAIITLRIEGLIELLLRKSSTGIRSGR